MGNKNKVKVIMIADIFFKSHKTDLSIKANIFVLFRKGTI